MSELLNEAWALVSAPLALRIYVLAAGAAVLVYALWQAYQEHKFLDDLDADYFEKTYPGPKPFLSRSRKRREKDIRNFRLNRWRNVWFRLGRLLFLGVILPSALLAAGGWWYGWFDSNQAPFLIVGTQTTITHPDLPKLGFFVLDELMRGGFLDALEVFHVDPHFLTHNHHNKVFSGGVLFYRTFVAIFEPTVIWFWLRAFLIARKIKHPALAAA